MSQNSYPAANTAVFLTLLPALASGRWTPQQEAILASHDPAQLAAWFNQQELGALAYLRLQAAGLAAPAAAHLAGAYWQAAAAAAIKLELLVQLQTALSTAGVPTVLLKGIASYLTLYPDPAIRPMNDLDFWLQPSAIATAWHTLEEMGLHGKGLWPTPEAIPKHVTQLDFYPDTPQTSAYNVEIHWDLSQRATVRGRLPLAHWWAGARTIPWRGRLFKVLSPPAALVHTAVHQMLEHRGEIQWRWLLDIDHLVRGRPGYALTTADWAQVQAEAQAAGVLPAVQAAIRLAAKWLQTPLPEPALALLAVQSDETERAQAADVARPGRSAMSKLFLNAAYTPGWRQKTAVIQPLLFPHPNYMMQRYAIRHKIFLPIYYLGRLAKGAALALRRVKHKK